MKQIYFLFLFIFNTNLAFATTHKITGPLTGAQDGNASTGTGTLLAVYDDVTNKLSYTIAYSGMTGAVNSAHFHGNAAAGSAAGVKVGLTVSASPMKGTVDVLEADESAMLSGLWYINLHTTMFAGGEIRGQFIKSSVETHSITGTLTGAQETPSVVTPATGTLTITYDNVSNTLTYAVTYTGLTGTLSAAHFHGNAAAGVAAGVKIGLTAASSPMVGTATVVEGDEVSMLGGLWYVNLHTSTFGGGEIRGQFAAAVALPVELSSFVFNREDQSILEWTTLSEHNTKSFDIEKSVDAISYETIGTVVAKGESTQKVDYSFKDTEYNVKTAYYRLKINDNDAKFAYSNIISVEPDLNQNTFEIFPNPTNDGVMFFKAKGVCDNLVITNQTGQILKTKKHLCHGEINISDLPNGWYNFSVRTPTGLLTERVYKSGK
jgi:hypothetical protein